jgi:hypothetical protein
MVNLCMNGIFDSTELFPNILTLSAFQIIYYVTSCRNFLRACWSRDMTTYTQVSQYLPLHQSTYCEYQSSCVLYNMHNSTHNINIISLSQKLKCEVERERGNLRYCSGTLPGGELADQAIIPETLDFRRYCRTKTFTYK